tara:strand:+ start:144 stop:356 length:213 start_codon:yes stop_codon:yes gene_type:complete
MSEEVDKEFVIDVLTNNALNQLTLPDALKVLTAKVRQDITTQVDGYNESELASVYESLRKVVKEKEEAKD